MKPTITATIAEDREGRIRRLAEWLYIRGVFDQADPDGFAAKCLTLAEQFDNEAEAYFGPGEPLPEYDGGDLRSDPGEERECRGCGDPVTGNREWCEACAAVQSAALAAEEP